MNNIPKPPKFTNYQKQTSPAHPDYAKNISLNEIQAQYDEIYILLGIKPNNKNMQFNNFIKPELHLEKLLDPQFLHILTKIMKLSSGNIINLKLHRNNLDFLLKIVKLFQLRKKQIKKKLLQKWAHDCTETLLKELEELEQEIQRELDKAKQKLNAFLEEYESIKNSLSSSNF